MPRRQFIADLDKAQNGSLPIGIANVKAGDDDGQIEFLFTGGADGPLPGPVKITAMIPELSDYPKSHEYMIFGDDDAPRDISNALQNVRGVNGKSVYELLDIVSVALNKVSPDKDGDWQMQDSQMDDEYDDEEEDEPDIYDSDHEAFEDSAPVHNPAYATQAPSVSKGRTPSDRKFRQRIRSDLRAAKVAGFKVGVLGHLLEGYNAYITLSVRISKLGISDEAMQAWQAEPSDYLILIIQYPNGYKTNEELQGYDSLRLQSNLTFRLVAGKGYKPTLQEAIQAFTVVKKEERLSVASTNLPGPESVDESSVRDTFISKSMVNLLQERLIPILRYRSAGMGWTGAENWYRHQAHAGAGAANADIVPDKFFEPERVNMALPNLVNNDHYATQGTTEYSFPLLAMQFVLRHFVRCTEFCLVCHRKLETEAEAIKPYVCDSPLCLYQYMSLGFGPSMEHEVVAQPYVVDLLVSFCYNSAAARKLKEYPFGLSLMVPPVDAGVYNVTDPTALSYRHRHKPSTTTQQPIANTLKQHPKYEVGFDRSRLELIFYDQSVGCPVRRGGWIVLNTGPVEGYDIHCRINDTTFFPTIHIDEPVSVLQQHNAPNGTLSVSKAPQTPAATRPVSPVNSTPNYVQATFQLYAQDFDELEAESKCLSICRLLDTLPNVTEMRGYLLKRQTADLRGWIERISPSALSLLRWIIASNRACIMQVDGDLRTVAGESKGAMTGYSKDQERCYGMKDYMQFRFAMGAPDKEQRFISEVRSTTARLSLKYPTLFAWHGSPLFNWHMIIREGLHYKNVDHGRAYGDGVYHAKEATTSSTYSGMYGAEQFRQGTWPASVLRISWALALNEIVNAPNEFTSSSPYYVVRQLEWIQTRYLFVQVQPTSDAVCIGAERRPQNAHPQDPERTPRGISEPIVIPAAAIKSNKTARGVGVKEDAKNPNPLKKLKLFGKAAKNPVVIEDDDDDDDDLSSVATDTEDLTILFDDELEPEPMPVANRLKPEKKPDNKGPKTDFIPGMLDFTTLPIMPLPTYASSATTRRLMKELQNLQKIQESTPLGELGWHIDIEKIENVYQWIVELHSFHTFEVKGKPLPLVADMKKQKVNSIVLEVRFNKDFPFTPPYVRVIRPRFLTLMQGGGGHIVAGGAMCMELLTNTGWSSVSSMESVLMQIRLAIASEPFAKLELKAVRGDYGTSEAADGYIRACQTHGWQVPPGFKEMAYGGQAG